MVKLLAIPCSSVDRNLYNGHLAYIVFSVDIVTSCLGTSPGSFILRFWICAVTVFGMSALHVINSVVVSHAFLYVYS